MTDWQRIILASIADNRDAAHPDHLPVIDQIKKQAEQQFDTLMSG